MPIFVKVAEYLQESQIAEIKLGAQSESRMGLQSASSSQETYFHFEVKIFPA